MLKISLLFFFAVSCAFGGLGPCAQSLRARGAALVESKNEILASARVVAGQTTHFRALWRLIDRAAAEEPVVMVTSERGEDAGTWLKKISKVGLAQRVTCGVSPARTLFSIGLGVEYICRVGASAQSSDIFQVGVIKGICLIPFAFAAATFAAKKFQSEMIDGISDRSEYESARTLLQNTFSIIFGAFMGFGSFSEFIRSTLPLNQVFAFTLLDGVLGALAGRSFFEVPNWNQESRNSLALQDLREQIESSPQFRGGYAWTETVNAEDGGLQQMEAGVVVVSDADNQPRIVFLAAPR